MTPLASPISPDTLLSGSSALLVLCVVLFAECGLLIGFFLPGDTLLFAAGIGLATDAITAPAPAFFIAAPIAAFVGNLVGYWIGRRTGPIVFDRPNSRMFRPEYVTRAQRFFDRFGAATIVIGRFVPIVRTVVTVLAGVARVRVRTYLIYSAVGAVLWTDGVLLLGHALGHLPWVRAHKGWVDYAVILVVVIGLVPALFHLARRRRAPDSVSSFPGRTGPLDSQ